MNLSLANSTDTDARPEALSSDIPWADSGETYGLRFAVNERHRSNPKKRVRRLIERSLSANIAKHLLTATARGADNSFWSGQTYGSRYHDAVAILRVEMENQRQLRSELNWKKHFGELSEHESRELEFLEMFSSQELKAELREQLDYLQTIIDVNK